MEEIDPAHFNRLPFTSVADAPPEDNPYSDEPVSLYEERNGVPLTAVKLGYKDTLSIDPYVEMKVRAVDEYIREQIEAQGLRDSVIGYDTIFNRLAAKLGTPIEMAIRHGDAKTVLEHMFMEVSLHNRQSSKSYLKSYEKRYHRERADRLTKQLKTSLQALKN